MMQAAPEAAPSSSQAILTEADFDEASQDSGLSPDQLTVVKRMMVGEPLGDPELTPAELEAAGYKSSAQYVAKRAIWAW